MKNPEAIADELRSLHPLIERIAKVSINTKETKPHLFSWCVRSAFVKAYEFADSAMQPDIKYASFLVPSLRCITEELIVLNFLWHLPCGDRESSARNLFILEIEEQTRQQSRFFATFRPFQPVLGGNKRFSMAMSSKINDELCSVWQRNGWPNFKIKNGRHMPPVREIAQKSAADILEIVYDYVYRLSSHAVHFQTSSLLRMGWGPTKTEFTFSSSPGSFDGYYIAVCRIYGCFLFCLYLELFEDFAELDKEEIAKLGRFRKLLLEEFWWPEMVTFEEVNEPRPEVSALQVGLHVIFKMRMEDGFISGANVNGPKG